MGTTTNLLEILIKLGIDPASASAVMRGTKSVEEALEGVGDAAKNISDEDLELIVKKMEEIEKATRATRQENERLEAQIKKTREEAGRLNQVAEKLTSIGMRATAAGAAILAPMLLAQKSYLEASKENETSSKAWLASSREIEASQNRLGREVTETLLPYYQSLAKVIQSISLVAEKNPWLVKGALGVGGALAIGGPLAALTGQGLKIVADAKFLAAATLQDVAADKMLAAAAMQSGKTPPGIPGVPGGAIGAVGLGTFAAVGAAVVVAQTLEAKAANSIGKTLGLSQDVIDAIAYLGSAGLYPLGKSLADFADDIIGLPEKINTASKQYGAKGGLIGPPQAYGVPGGLIGPPVPTESGNAIARAVSEKEKLSLEAFAAWKEASDALVDAEKKSEAERTKLIADQSAKRAELERDYDNQRRRSITQFAQSLLDADQDYYRQRREVAQSYSVDVQRSEEDHQREMVRSQRAHNSTLADLVAARDAYGYVKAQRAFEQQRVDAEDDYQISAARRSEDFARQIGELEGNFRIQRERRIRDFEQQLVESDKQHELQMQKFDEQSAERLQQYDEQNAAELEQLRQTEQDRLATLRAIALGDLSMLNRESAKVVAEFHNWLKAAGKSVMAEAWNILNSSFPTGFTTTPTTSTGGGGGRPTVRPRAAGGYAEYGRYLLGESRSGGPGRREFVLNGETTRAAEATIGGQLSQAAVMNAFYGGNSNSRQVNYHDNRRFSGGISAQDRRAIRQDTLDAIGEVLDD